MAKPRTIKASEFFEEIHLNLWGTLFRMRSMTRDLEDEISNKWEALEDLDGTVDEHLPAFYEFIELYLEPLEGKDAEIVADLKRPDLEVRAKELDVDAPDKAKTKADLVTAVEQAIAAQTPTAIIERELEANNIGRSHVIALCQALLTRGSARPT